MSDISNFPLLTILKDAGLLDDMQAETVIQESTHTGKRVFDIVADMGVVDRETMLQMMADNLATQVVDLKSMGDIPKETIEAVPAETAKNYQCFPVELYGTVLQLAMEDPFNPAAVGRAIIFASFMGATTDLVTSATPTTVIASTYNWLPATSSVLDTFLEQFGGFMGLALGTYPGAIGETFSIAIILVGIYLAFRQMIDWRVPVTYLGGIFVLTAIVALLTGIESYHGIPGFIWYPVLHLLTGGVIFGGVFMLTDPVTSPTSAGGRVIFALGAAVLTVLIRLKANLPEGCLYSILLMNLFTPMIENALDGKQLEIKKKVWTGFICIAIVGLGVSFYAASSIEPVTKIESEATSMVVDNVPVEHVQEEVSL